MERMTAEQLAKIKALLPFFTSEYGTDYVAWKTPDGDNGWVTTWYVWSGSDWETIDQWEVPDDVVTQYDPYF